VTLLTGKTALLLDMNGTFMFGEDRFGESEDFSERYIETNGTLERTAVNTIVRAAYRYLHIRYPDDSYRLTFPSVETAVRAVVGDGINGDEIENIVNLVGKAEDPLAMARFENLLELRDRFYET
jgi:hypothetical protein